MSRVSYVNGRYLPHTDALIHIDDRGLQFADAVYEVIGVQDGAFVDEERHLARLVRSLDELRIELPFTLKTFRHVFREILRRNRLANGMIYLQVTRGIAPRDHAFPRTGVRPSVMVTGKRLDREAIARRVADGMAVVTAPDLRWGRVDIKTTGLLPNLLAKQTAVESNAQEAWLVDQNGFITEGSSTNAWIVDGEGTLITHPLGHDILGGVTRQTLLEAARLAGVRLLERPFTVEDALSAREAFSSASTYIIMPVVQINGKAIGNAVPGSVTMRLREAFDRVAELS